MASDDLSSAGLSGIDSIWLMHWGWDKMATFLQMTISNSFCMKIVVLWFWFHWNQRNLFLRARIKIWHWTFDNPLSEVMMVVSTDAYMCHLIFMNEILDNVWGSQSGLQGSYMNVMLSELTRKLAMLVFLKNLCLNRTALYLHYQS